MIDPTRPRAGQHVWYWEATTVDRCPAVRPAKAIITTVHFDGGVSLWLHATVSQPFVMKASHVSTPAVGGWSRPIEGWTARKGIVGPPRPLATSQNPNNRRRPA